MQTMTEGDRENLTSFCPDLNLWVEKIGDLFSHINALTQKHFQIFICIQRHTNGVLFLKADISLLATKSG